MDVWRLLASVMSIFDYLGLLSSESSVGFKNMYRAKEIVKVKGAPFSPSTGSLRFNLSPASFTQLPSIISLTQHLDE
jgi:hypothetical protein